MKIYKPYFSHDMDARDNEKLILLRMDYKWEGYGLFWAIVELMRGAEDYKLLNSMMKVYSHKLDNTDITLLQGVINRCIELKLFVMEGDYFYAPSLTKRMNQMQEINKQKSNAGKKGMDIRWKNKAETSNLDLLDNGVITENNSVITDDNNIKIKINKTKDKYKTKKEVSFDFPESLSSSKEFKATWDQFVLMRKIDLKKPMSISLVNKKLKWLSGFPINTAIKMVENSYRNNWYGIFELKSFNNEKSGTASRGTEEFGDDYDRLEAERRKRFGTSNIKIQ